MVEGARLESKETRVQIPTETFFILIISLVSRSSQLDRAHANEIKHDIHPR